jgi:tungstate transport system substrate-binding protein
MKKLIPIVSVLFIMAMVLGACASASPTEAPAVEQPAAEEPTAEESVAEEQIAEEPAEEEPAAVEPVAEEPADTNIILATTTSTADSGLLDFILPVFTEKTGVTVDVIAVGTGQALELGENGDADVLLVHARALEDAFMEAGHGVRREDVMYNDFVIVGPPDDPAGIKGKGKSANALDMISQAGATFVSRGDESGTHVKEKALWADAGIEPAGDWYVSAGQGMGDVLVMANEQLAYTMSDRATYLALKLEGIELEIMVEGDPILFNPYGVIAVNPDKSLEINNDLANQFIDWLISLETQELIGTFGVDTFGAPLFIPDSPAYREAQAAANTPDVEGDLVVFGEVKTPMGWAEDEVRAMDTTDAVGTNSDGAEETYTGVLIATLLNMAEPKTEATTLVIIADDGYAVEVPLAEMLACEDCILSFRTNGGFSSVLPGYAKNTMVKGVVQLQVK